jgi:hydrophobic/amphiphilic exporter-1 (mainly G- bacteria), HAE1 family
VVIAFNLPAIIGLSTTGGFEYQLEDLQGRTPEEFSATVRGLAVAANQQPELANVFSTFNTDTPQVYLKIDREKAQTLGVLPTDIFQALQTSLGGYYVNDFNLFGRVWQVVIQGEAADRNDVEDIYRINVRNSSGTMVPLRALAEAELRLGPAAVIRFNNFRGATVQGNPAPGHTSGAALAAMERVSKTTLPEGYAFEWSGSSAH